MSVMFYWQIMQSETLENAHTRLVKFSFLFLIWKKRENMYTQGEYKQFFPKHDKL